MIKPKDLIQNQTKSIKLFVFDIDGTLFQTDISEIPSATVETLYSLKEKNYKLAICTSRSIDEMIHFPKNIFKLMDVVATSCGGNIYSNGHYEYTNMDYERVEKIMKVIDDNDVVCRWVDNNGHGYLNRSVPDIDALFDYEYNMIPPCKKWKNEKVIQIVYYSSINSIINNIHDQLRNESILDFSYIHEITANDISKSSTLSKIERALNVSKEETVAFGDGESDAGMIKEAGIGIAMGNAGKSCKAAADFITDSIENNGIQMACKRFNWI